METYFTCFLYIFKVFTHLKSKFNYAIKILWLPCMIDYFNKNFTEYKAGFSSQGKYVLLGSHKKWITLWEWVALKEYDV